MIKKTTYITTAVIVCIIIAVIMGVLLPKIFKTPETTDNIGYDNNDDLQKASYSFMPPDMEEKYRRFGHLIVKDFSEITHKNPTFNNVERITELPVFENEKGLWSDSYDDLNDIDDLIYFSDPIIETTSSYSFRGEINDTRNVCFQYDKNKSIADQLLDYSFHRIFYTRLYSDGHTGEIGGAKILKPTKNPGILYPIISRSEAEIKFRNGDFFCYGDEKEVASTADILSVEIAYIIPMSEEYDLSHLQPYYVFYIKDASWDISFMDCENKDEFFSVSPVYVPALQEKYLEVTKPSIYFN